MGRSSLEWLCFFIAVVHRGPSPLRIAATFSFEQDRSIFLPNFA
jgi:hypothetical protein